MQQTSLHSIDWSAACGQTPTKQGNGKATACSLPPPASRFLSSLYTVSLRSARIPP
jgi:hypothetical protein